MCDCVTHHHMWSEAMIMTVMVKNPYVLKIGDRGERGLFCVKNHWKEKNMQETAIQMAKLRFQYTKETCDDLKAQVQALS